ncbi:MULTISPECIES: hypothetical protein [unclassified Streptomyces]|uniref:hypothetical protein n=1 Tax=unclassified Streptomyces TaxID=2593676 RepID=UPI0004C4CE02|nr:MULTISPECIES: hypothetical protein [unclassified Streptomyces]
MSQSTVSHLISGRRKTVYAAKEAALLMVRLADQSGAFYVSALGATRRVRALYVLGHGPTVLAAATGLHRDAITQLAGGKWSQILSVRDQAVREAYGRLSMTVGVTREARSWAARQGWVPPLAWDDDTIDDPAAVPSTDAPMPGFTEGDDVVARFLLGESVVLDRAAQREVIAHLMEWSNDTPEEIGARLGMTGTAVGQTWVRMNREAREAGRPVPWRRVYIPRNEINQNDMRRAA